VLPPALPPTDIDPRTRFTAEQALNHPWVNGNVKANNLLQSPREIRKIQTMLHAGRTGQRQQPPAQQAQPQAQPAQHHQGGMMNGGTGTRQPLGGGGGAGQAGPKLPNYGAMSTASIRIQQGAQAGGALGSSIDSYDGDASPSPYSALPPSRTQPTRKYSR
jgi:hypothetical protein